MADDGLILNICSATKNASDTAHKKPSIRAQVKEVGGSWKERNRVRKAIKSQIKKSAKSYVPLEHDYNTAENGGYDLSSNNEITQKKFPKNKSAFARVENSKEVQEKSKKSGNAITTTQPHQVISSLFTSNPTIPPIKHNNQQNDNFPSNAPVDDSNSFIGMGLDADLVAHVKEKLNAEKPTDIQCKAIPLLLNSNNISRNEIIDLDVVIQAETGSGKTLAFLLPIIERLIRATKSMKSDSPLTRSLGTLAIILTPTRELAKQTLSVLESLLSIPPSKTTNNRLQHWIVPGIVNGGVKKKAEKARLRRGVNLLVSTPGRLLDHLQNTRSFSVENLRWLVLDEADRLLELGFEETLQKIIQMLDDRSEAYQKINQKNCLFDSEILPKRRQTILCSATLKDDVRRLAGQNLFNPTYINGTDQRTDKVNKGHSTHANNSKLFTTPNQLKQKCIVTPAKLRLVTLTAILKSTFKRHSESISNEKVIVFFSCCDAVDFYFDLFANAGNLEQDSDNDQNVSSETSLISTVIPNLMMFRLHGELSQTLRTTTFQKFGTASSGVLFCTDVAARGLDLPNVSKIFQYDPPTDIKDYVHRVGRTARLGKDGEAMLFLLPSEVGYIDSLEARGINTKNVQVDTVLRNLTPMKPSEYELEATSIQLSFERYVLSDNQRISRARKAYLSYIRAYATHSSSEKEIFHIKKLHLGHLAKSFALREAPSNITNIESKRSKKNHDKITQKKFPPTDKVIQIDRFKLNNTGLAQKRKLDVNEFAVGSYKSMIGPTVKKKRKIK
ncbi:5565_t:CDS:2 [Ambispora gerdemannii]|uniref:ATP-dependent RNA helicase n=1 Tax=Ambispora gerdemannii TaxID=144530 RepID=A0A9N8W0D7_9GLOM|nr:5565_t:CDS:2 [Ambispora gerdemannii]